MDDYVISVSDLKEYLKENENVQLIDVRSPQEHKIYNIGGTVIPITELPNRLYELDPNKTTIIYCHTGVRGLMAVKILMNAGFKSVKSLAGGVLAWQADELT